MSRRQHFLETNDNAREENLRFVRNPEDDLQQFFGGSNDGRVAVPPRDYKIVTPKPDHNNYENIMENRKDFFRQLGLPRHEVYEWAKRSLELPTFDTEFYRNRRHQLRTKRFGQECVDRQIFEEIKKEYREATIEHQGRRLKHVKSRSVERSRKSKSVYSNDSKVERSRNRHRDNYSRNSFAEGTPPAPPLLIKEDWQEYNNDTRILRARSRSQSPQRHFHTYGEQKSNFVDINCRPVSNERILRLRKRSRSRSPRSHFRRSEDRNSNFFDERDSTRRQFSPDLQAQYDRTRNFSDVRNIIRHRTSHISFESSNWDMMPSNNEDLNERYSKPTSSASRFNDFQNRQRSGSQYKEQLTDLERPRNFMRQQFHEDQRYQRGVHNSAEERHQIPKDHQQLVQEIHHEEFGGNKERLQNVVENDRYGRNERQYFPESSIQGRNFVDEKAERSNERQQFSNRNFVCNSIQSNAPHPNLRNYGKLQGDTLNRYKGFPTINQIQFNEPGQRSFKGVQNHSSDSTQERNSINHRDNQYINRTRLFAQSENDFQLTQQFREAETIKNSRNPFSRLGEWNMETQKTKSLTNFGGPNGNQYQNRTRLFDQSGNDFELTQQFNEAETINNSWNPFSQPVIQNLETQHNKNLTNFAGPRPQTSLGSSRQSNRGLSSHEPPFLTMNEKRARDKLFREMVDKRDSVKESFLNRKEAQIKSQKPKFLPHQTFGQPSYWIDWWKENGWLENVIPKAYDNDPDLLKEIDFNFDVFTKISQTKKATRKLLISSEKLVVDTLNHSRELVVTNVYGFLKTIVQLHGFFFHKKKIDFALSKRSRQLRNHLRHILQNAPMLKCYLTIIDLWKSVYSCANDISVCDRSEATKLLNEKLFNWLVGLALNEIKRFSNRIMYVPPKEDQLKNIFNEVSKITANNPNVKRIFFFNESYTNPQKALLETMNICKVYLQNKPNLRFKSVSRFLAARILLTDDAWNNNINIDLKREKDEFLKKLHTCPVVDMVYENILKRFIRTQDRVNDITLMHPRLRSYLHAKQLQTYQKFYQRIDVQYMCKFALLERLKKYGTLEDPRIRGDGFVETNLHEQFGIEETHDGISIDDIEDFQDIVDDQKDYESDNQDDNDDDNDDDVDDDDDGDDDDINCIFPNKY